MNLHPEIQLQLMRERDCALQRALRMARRAR